MKLSQRPGFTLFCMASLVFLAGTTVPTPARAELPVSQIPLHVSSAQDAPPLNMLVMGRDHKLYYEAYNDASDLNGDGVLDVGYKGHLSAANGGIDYFGYFDSHRCYSYNVSEGRFQPGSEAPNKTCSGAWSGDFLNYLTTSRMDAVRKVLYGGYRSVDTDSLTVLERAYIPQDAHSWGKEYTSQAVDGYNLQSYAPIALPQSGRRVLFANTTLRQEEDRGPLLRVLTNSRYRIWEWVSIERPVAGTKCQHGSDGPDCAYPSGQMPHPGHPTSRSAFDSIEATYAVTDYFYGTSTIDRINCSSNNCNPHGSDDNYLTIVEGRIRIDHAGHYIFRIDGDDAIDFRMWDAQGDVVAEAGCYAGRGFDMWSCTNGNLAAVANNLPAGTYSFKFRHEDMDGGDGYRLKWERRTAQNGGGDDWDAQAGFGTGAFPRRIVRVVGESQRSDDMSGITDESSRVKYRDRANQTGGFVESPTFRFYNLRPNGSASVMTDYVVRVEVCDAGTLEENCVRYDNGNHKPTGILHDYSGKMKFGLVTGSYKKNIDGGALRRNMADFLGETLENFNGTGASFNIGGEINPTTGRVLAGGIIETINKLRTVDFNTQRAYENRNGEPLSPNCGWIADGPIESGECRMWGNPVGEMMYEALRYFAGAKLPRSEFDIGTSGRDFNAPLSLSAPAWIPPYLPTSQGGSGNLRCATPVMTVISDINPSYDYSLPGSVWDNIGTSGDPSAITGLNVAAEATSITNAEGISGLYFVGEAGGVADSAPTAKTVTTLANVRGLAPEEPSKLGTYYSASVARFGANRQIGGDKNLLTYAVALASPLPRFDFPVGNRRITLVPFAKSVGGGYGIDREATFQPTNQIVDFYVQTIANTDPDGADASPINGGRPYAVFRINYEDVEQGADHDMDAIVLYTLEVTGDNKLKVTLSSDYAAGGIIQHMGYVISGTTTDGVYLEVRDRDTSEANSPAYKLNTPPDKDAGECDVNPVPADCGGLPLLAVREFTPGATPGADVLEGPLWYAAKYGRPPSYDWDEDGDGTPDNYFLVTNAGTLKEQLDKAFAQILADTRSSGGTAASGSRHSDGFLAYVPEYDTRDWTGDIKAYRVNRGTGALIQPAVWSVATQLAAVDADDRDIHFVSKADPADPDDIGTLQTFEANDLGADADAQAQALGFASEAATGGTIAQVVNYLRGDKTLEVTEPDNGTGRFRRRGTLLGDIMGSQPAILGTGSYGYSMLPLDEGGGYNANGTIATGGYVDFVKKKKDRTPVAFLGANDGMLHAINASDDPAEGGKELFAIIPNSVLSNLHELTSPGYQHRYYVDGSPEQGDACIGGPVGASSCSWKTVILAPMGAGGRSILAIDATDPAEDGAQLLWEFTHPDLGLTIGKPRIARWNGRWVAIFGNGYNAPGLDNASRHKAMLFVLDLETGELLHRIRLGTQGTELTPNGLATTFPVDLNRDADADLVYAGDYYGNLWRISLKEYGDTDALEAVQLYEGELATVGTGANAVSVPVHPITGGVNVTYHPARGQMVLFGTGKYFLEGDNAAYAVGDPVNSFFGVWDDPLAPSLSTYPLEKSDLQQQSFATGTVAGTRTVTGSAVNWNDGKFGWYINLPDPGERFVGIPEISLGRVIFTSFVAEGDECAPGGYNWLNVLSATSGIGMINQGRGGGEGLGSIALPTDGGGGPAPTPPTVTVPPEQACDPDTDPDCEPPPPECDPDTDPDCTPDCDPITGQCSTQNFSARGCETRVGVLTHLGIIDFDSFACGRQSWKQYE